jgi:hypothetical protein
LAAPETERADKAAEMEGRTEATRAKHARNNPIK